MPGESLTKKKKLMILSFCAKAFRSVYVWVKSRNLNLNPRKKLLQIEILLSVFDYMKLICKTRIHTHSD